MKSAATLGAAALAALMALSMTACGAASNNAGTPGRYTANSSYGQAYNGTEPYRYSPIADNKANVKRNLNDAGRNNTGLDIGRAVRDTTNDMKNAAQNIADGVTDTGRNMVNGMTGGTAANRGTMAGSGISGGNTANSTLGTGTAKNPNLTGIAGTN